MEKDDASTGRRIRNWNRGRGTRFVFASCHQNLSTSSDLEMKREGERERENLSSDNNHVKHFNHVKTREIFLIFYVCQMLITDLIVVFILHSCCLGFFIFRFIKIASNMHYTITTIYVHISNSRSSTWIPAPSTIT